MKRRTADILFIVFFLLLLFGITAADLLWKDRLFSENENRLLASRPQFSFEALFLDSLTTEYDTYYSDQFVLRDQWIRLKTFGDLALGKKEIKGIYLAKDGSLIERHPAEAVDSIKAGKKLALLQELTEHYRQSLSAERIRVMLIPTADSVLKDRLPSYAQGYDQQDFVKQAETLLGKQICVPAASILSSHAGEQIYYRTDHHWTTLGAYYGYCAWAESLELEPRSLSEYDIDVVTEDFLGTLHSRINIPVKPDRIDVFSNKEESPVKVWYDFSDTYVTSLYEEKHLDTKNQYGYFLDDNHPFIKIQTNTPNQRTLFVIKDSYANCLIPFLTSYYETICIVDLRYYRMGLYDLIESQNTTDLLVLYDVIHFIEDFQYY